MQMSAAKPGSQEVRARATDLDLGGVFTPTYLISVVLMFLIAFGGLMVASHISP
ncbi:protein of unknown function [Candidatus Hydrogenisulfobacillus filiaventi]|uniref:Uncharacterized protein n=1 Tax=Candidatus Hydrogenisulfobacillus filiaventi TaxID=2707344 RepID=A0A6F8ZGF3_9FIRM|nr:hypothetical protein [Bacillota bacterium]CAB1129020.1 protein of unknown function [Candidatus Hydrogenisulfobacillus filiaventi]